MKHLTILILMMLSYSQLSMGQKKFSGRQEVNTEYGKKIIHKITYVRSLLKSGNLYVTKYLIFNESKKHIASITAYHNTSSKSIDVDVIDPNSEIFSSINSEKYEYDVPTMGGFGEKGSLYLLDNTIPFQLALSFISNKFEHVKVLTVNATRPGSKDFVRYVLNTEFTN